MRKLLWPCIFVMLLLLIYLKQSFKRTNERKIFTGLTVKKELHESSLSQRGLPKSKRKNNYLRNCDMFYKFNKQEWTVKLLTKQIQFNPRCNNNLKKLIGIYLFLYFFP